MTKAHGSPSPRSKVRKAGFFKPVSEFGFSRTFILSVPRAGSARGSFSDGRPPALPAANRPNDIDKTAVEYILDWPPRRLPRGGAWGRSSIG